MRNVIINPSCKQQLGLSDSQFRAQRTVSKSFLGDSYIVTTTNNTICIIIWPLTPIIDRATFLFLKSDMRQGAKYTVGCDRDMRLNCFFKNDMQH